ncbi:MAG: hypothetical protein C0515_02105 [Novosphingobium sp.]|nr:hypothetical protein [Novosphingobium sp.]
MPPSARELRAQAVQRLQAGLFGIAAVVLVVGLANIINDRARQSDAAAKPAASAAPRPSVSDSSDPLADVGVVPSNVPEAAASPGPAAPTAQN